MTTRTPHESYLFRSRAETIGILPTNPVLTRFRHFVGSEKLTSGHLIEFLATEKNWWLITDDKAALVHAHDVLTRLDFTVEQAELAEFARRPLATNPLIGTYLDAIEEGPEEDPQDAWLMYVRRDNRNIDKTGTMADWLTKRNGILDAFKSEWAHDPSVHTCQGWLQDIQNANFYEHIGKVTTSHYTRLPKVIRRLTNEQRMFASKVIARLALNLMGYTSTGTSLDRERAERRS